MIETVVAIQLWAIIYPWTPNAIYGFIDRPVVFETHAECNQAIENQKMQSFAKCIPVTPDVRYGNAAQQ